MAAKPLDRVELDERRQLLQNRLNDGYQRIEEAEADGSDITEWETFWIKLLHEYEATCRELEVLSGISPIAPQTPGNGQQAALMSRGSGW